MKMTDTLSKNESPFQKVAVQMLLKQVVTDDANTSNELID